LLKSTKIIKKKIELKKFMKWFPNSVEKSDYLFILTNSKIRTSHPSGSRQKLFIQIKLITAPLKLPHASFNAPENHWFHAVSNIFLQIWWFFLLSFNQPSCSSQHRRIRTTTLNCHLVFGVGSANSNQTLWLFQPHQ
jgi:hypothetical protein